MKEVKKYIDVIRYGKRGTQEVLSKDDYITITEKIDCANASFTYDADNEIGVGCYSRNTEVNKDNTLRGFYGWVTEKIVPIKDNLNPNYRYYGEFGCSHKVQYKPEVYGQFHMFSIWDDELQEYLSDDIVKSEAVRLGLQTVPYFYEGEFISYEHLMSFVGKSDLTIEPNTGEGIVVKNVNYKDRYDKQVFVKLVSEKFAEIQKQKAPKDPNKKNPLRDLTMSVLTEARVEKMLYKLVDEDLLDSEYGIEDMGIILKALGTRIFEDIVKEELDLFSEYEINDVKKMICKNQAIVVKKVVLNKTNN